MEELTNGSSGLSVVLILWSGNQESSCVPAFAERNAAAGAKNVVAVTCIAGGNYSSRIESLQRKRYELIEIAREDRNAV